MKENVAKAAPGTSGHQQANNWRSLHDQHLGHNSISADEAERAASECSRYLCQHINRGSRKIWQLYAMKAK